MSTTLNNIIHAAEATGVARTGNSYYEAVYSRYAGLLLQPQPASRQAIAGARDAACRRLAAYLNTCASMAATEPDAWRDLYAYRNARGALTERGCQAALEPTPLRPIRRAGTKARLRHIRRRHQPGPAMEAGFEREIARAKDAYFHAVYGLYMPLLLQGAPRQAITGARDAACRRLAAYLDVCAAWAATYPASWRRHVRPAESA